MTLMDRPCQAFGEDYDFVGAPVSTQSAAMLSPFQSRPRRRLRVPEELKGCVVHILGDVEGQILAGASVLQAIASSIAFDVNIARGLRQVSRAAETLQLVTIQIDDHHTLGRTIGLLQKFRRQNPLAVVVTGSRYFKADDLSHERFAICDASIRTPSSPEAMLAAFEAATANNTRLLHVS